MKRKIALIVQRYGLEVNGGSEYHCRLVAEMLSKHYEVEVLTTKALDYTTWEDYYTNDIEVINNVTVRRFSIEKARNVKDFNKYSEFLFSYSNRNVYDELEWMRMQGPTAFQLIDYIDKSRDSYDVFVFFTYLYFTTYWGMQLVPGKSVLVPTAHDEPPVYLSMFKSFFHLPRYILYNTNEEKEFIEKTFKNEYIQSDIVGVGVDIPDISLSGKEFCNKFNIKEPFILYVGRIDESKGCKELFDFYKEYKSNLPVEAPKLVLIGKSVMNIPNDKDIIHLGFLTNEEKFGALEAAECLIMPSKFESLSMVVLESLYQKTPILVNGQSEVLVGHCVNSNGGLYYANFNEFSLGLDTILSNIDLKNGMGRNGHKYVTSKYSWKRIEENFIKAIESIVEES